MNSENQDILDLSPFSKGIRESFQIVQDVFEMLTIFNDKYPIQHKDYLVRMRYPIGVEFFENFALNKLDYEEMNFALNCIYTYIGLEAVIEKIANFTGLRLKVEDRDNKNRKLTVSIVSENIFDLNLFEKKLTDFLKDVLLFSGIDFTFDIIVLMIKLSYNKRIMSVIQKQNIIPLEITDTITI